MALDKETKIYIAKMLGITVEEFDKNNSDEKEIKITIPKNKIIPEADLATTKIFTAEEMEEYDKNLKAPEYGRGVDDGKKNSVEVFVKGIRDEEGLELSSAQLTRENLISALKTKYGGDNKALISKFDEDKQTLISNAKSVEETLNGKIESMSSVMAKMSLRNSLNNAFKGDMTLDKDDALDIFMNRMETKKDEAGKEFVYLNGVIQQDQQLNPVSVDKVWNDYIIEKKWNKEASGREGGNEGGNEGVTKTFQAFAKEMSDKNIREGSTDYNDALNARLEDKEFRESVESDS